MFISLECKYNMLQTAKKSIQERLLSQELRDSQSFSVSICVCAAILGRRASRNFSKGLEKTLLDGVVNGSAIVDFFPPLCTDCLTGCFYHYFVMPHHLLGICKY